MKQNGNALFLILIAVALFAALSYAVTQSGRGGGNIDREKTQLEVAQAFNYISAVRAAITKMSVLGVNETDLCFDSSNWGHTNYNHAACADTSNQVFDNSGGGVAWLSPPQNLNSGEDWVFGGLNVMQNVGTAASDLIMILPNVSESACIAFNMQTGVGASVPVDVNFFSATKFIGAYTPADGTLQYAGGGSFSDICVLTTTSGADTVGGRYYFVATLKAR